MRKALWILGTLVVIVALPAEKALTLAREPLALEPVLSNGRVKPYEAFARQTLKLLAGSERFEGKSALETMRAAHGNPEQARRLEWIRLDYAPLAGRLGLPAERRRFSLAELEPKIPDVAALARSAREKRDRDERPSKIEQKAELLERQIGTASRLAEGAIAPDASGDANRLAMEVWYFRFRPFETAAVFYFLSAVLLSALGRRRALQNAGLAAFAAAFAFHTMGLAARVAVLGRPPVSNMYESMVYMNWAVTLLAAAFAAGTKRTLPLSAGAALGGMVMVYANLLPLDPSLDVLVPVLRSNYWLSIHVLTVVSSYGAFGLAMALGHRQLLLESLGKLDAAARAESAALTYRIMQIGVILIGTGTFLGGVWANESWGRFWGWDPKETWALITFLGYLIVVHLRHLGRLSDTGVALASIVGFQLVLMTWYGVNFVLGRGLHSYGAGTGGMQWVIYYLLFEAAFVGFFLLKKKTA